MTEVVTAPERVWDCDCAEPHGDSREFYVSVRDAGRTGLLLGPYDTHGAAIYNVDRGRKLANEANNRAWFYAYGTLSLPKGTNQRTVFGS